MVKIYCLAFTLLFASKPVKMNLNLTFAEDATILIQMPVPEVGEKYKTITVDHFQEHVRLLMYLEYRPVELKLKGLTITRAVFHLPEPPDTKAEIVSYEDEKRKEGLSISITVLVDSPDCVVEIEDMKFKGDEIEKIEKTLGKETYYITDLVIKDSKLVKITFKRQKS